MAFGILHLRNLFAVVMLSGIYSLLSAGLLVTLDAVDVAFTEAAVGGGIATMLMLAMLSLVGDRERTREGDFRVVPLLLVLATGALLLYGTLDMPYYGDADAPIDKHVVPRYLEESGKEIGLPNVVTSILASYRGYDTMGELTVIFTAGVGVLLLIGRFRRPGGNE